MEKYTMFMDRMEKEMATHSSTLAWKIPWMEEPGRLQPMGSRRVRQDWLTSLSGIGEENGNPLQCSCLENPRDGGARWAAIYGVTQSQTRLKWFSSSSSQGYLRRQWHPTPVLLPGKYHGWRSLVGCSPWGCEHLGHDWATSLSHFTFMHWRRKWQPTPVFLPRESQGLESLVGCHLWGHTESDTTEVT